MSVGLWIQAELIAMATDLAEFVGAAIALNLLFGMPLLPAGLVTAVVAFALLGLQTRGYRRFEIVIAGMLGVILLGFLVDTLLVPHDAAGIAGGLIPGFAGTDSLLLATGILGATVMPHVIYLHSALTQRRMPARDDAERRRILSFQRVDVMIAMGVAGVINMSMLVIAASLFHGSGAADVDTIEGAHAAFGDLVGPGAALAFALALLASGFAASSVGTYAGQVVMQGFINRTIPLILRRAVTMAPALVVLGHRDRSVARAGHVAGGAVVRDPVRAGAARAAHSPPRRHGRARQPPLTTALASTVAALIICLNGFLLVQTFA